MKYSDEQRIEKILNYATRLQKYISEKNITREKILNEVELQWLVTTPLYNIGEHVYNLSKNFKSANENIQWKRGWNQIAIDCFDFDRYSGDFKKNLSFQ